MREVEREKEGYFFLNTVPAQNPHKTFINALFFPDVVFSFVLLYILLSAAKEIKDIPA